MILSLKTEIGGCKTCFAEKTWNALLADSISTQDVYEEYVEAHWLRFGEHWNSWPMFLTHSKLHAIVEDKGNRWHAGSDIHLYINHSTPEAFQFAPVVRCASVQNIEIWHQPELFNFDPPRPWIFIDGVSIMKDKVDALLVNEGFRTYEHFAKHYDKDFSGKIIHWTDFKY
jgi:hypothetical protein